MYCMYKLWGQKAPNLVISVWSRFIMFEFSERVTAKGGGGVWDFTPHVHIKVTYVSTPIGWLTTHYIHLNQFHLISEIFVGI